MNDAPTPDGLGVEPVPARGSALRFPCGEAPEPGQAKEVAPGVMWMRLPLPTSTMYINTWAVRDGDGWAVFDVGMHTDSSQALWRAVVAPGGPLGGRPPTRIFGTHLHVDHIGMAGWLSREFGCELWMTRTEYLQGRMVVADAGREAPPETMRFYRRAGWDAAVLEAYRGRFGRLGKSMSPLPESYHRVQDGQRIPIGDHDWQVVVGAGHSPEHACFHCPDLGVLISGDQVLPLISSNVSVLPVEPLADPLGDWLSSIARFRRTLGDEVLVLPAHHDPFRGLHARLDRLAEKRTTSLARLRRRLAEAPQRAVDTFGTLFSRPEFGDLFVMQLATGEAIAYLNHLVRRGEASVTEDTHGIAWFRASM